MYHIVAQAIGFLAMAICIGSYQIKNSRMLILVKMSGDVIYVFHYIMLGAFSGAAALALGAFNALVCGSSGQRWAEWKGWKWLVAALLTAASSLTWNGPVSLLALISTLTASFSLWSGKAHVIRIIKLLIAGPALLTYGIFVHSWSGILCEAIGMVSAAIGLARFGLRSEENA